MVRAEKSVESQDRGKIIPANGFFFNNINSRPTGRCLPNNINLFNEIRANGGKYSWFTSAANFEFDDAEKIKISGDCKNQSEWIRGRKKHFSKETRLFHCGTL